MKLLFIADGRSPTALNWMSYFIERGHAVHLLSTFPAAPELDFASVRVVPVALSGAAGAGGGGSVAGRLLKAVSTAGMRTRIRQLAGGWTLGRAAKEISAAAEMVQPDVVHALRIPFEGMAAAQARLNAPLVVSVWGNDLTLHAPAARQMGRLTRDTLARADALLADCARDLRLAAEWGFAAEKPQALFPGGGGMRAEVFYAPEQVVSAPVVIQPRGLRAYVRNDVFFRAVPLVLAAEPGARFICPAMAGEAEAEHWVERLGIGSAVRLLPKQSQAEMAALYRSARVMVSPSEHDGTPNTLLEALASGCVPVAGDIESVREWVTDGENGLLVDAGDVQALAEALIRALRDDALAQRARTRNTRLVAERASRETVMPQAEAFYQALAAGKAA